MIVKIFGNKGGGSASASIDYLTNQKKHDDKAEVLQGDPELSKEIAEGLEFKNKYTVGCLSFEEPNLSYEQKREIMERFEKTICGGLEVEQYNILWVEHTDKGRLELNFFIPNVELESGKRLQPYYDKADRPLVENFKQVINYEYGLTDPHDPNKQQTLISRLDMPKEKKEVVKAIDEGITTLAINGKIKNRADVIQALEKAGFEIARTTPKNISIKSEGQNIRLKGAFYEQDFRSGESIRATIEERARDYKRNSGERYKTARERLDKAVSRREREFTKRYKPRGNQSSKGDSYGIQHGISDCIVDSVSSNTRLNVRDLASQGRAESVTTINGGVETISGQMESRKQGNQIANVPTRENQLSVRGVSDEKRVEREQGRDVKSNKTALENNKNQGLKENDGDRKTTRERIKRVIEQVRAKYEHISGRVKDFARGKRLNPSDVQGDYYAKQSNQRAINSVITTIKTLEQEKINKQEQRKAKGKSWGWGR